MAQNNRDRIIKVAGYAKRVFFNDNIEYRNFSPDLVGLQFTSDGGSALFTMGNFSITTNAEPSQYTVFNLGNYSKPYTLNDVTKSDEKVLEIQKNLIAGLNLDLTNPLNFIWYGSAEEMFRVSLNHIRDYFPAAIYVDNKVGSVTGNNITNYSYDSANEESSFSVSTSYFNNLFGIKYTTDYKYKTSDIEEYLEYDKIVYNENENENPIRNFTLNYGKYVIEHNNISKSIKRVTTPTVETDATLTIVAEGNPFPELTGINFSSYDFLNSTFNASIPFFIKPNEIERQNFFSSLNYLEKNILNENISPKYTMVITKPVFSDEGVLVFIEDKLTFPLLTDGYNLNFFDSLYLSYLNQITEYAEALDKYSTDIIIRKYTTDAVSSFDTIPRGDGNDLTLDGERASKLFRIYGREFDEIKQYIDGIKLAHVVTYDKKNNIPDSLVKDLSLMLGLDGFNFLNTFNIKENVLPSYGDVTYSGISKTLSNQELDIEIYRRLILNIAWLWKSKGARKAVEFLFRFIGAPESLVNFNEFIVMMDKPLDMEKIKQLLYIYTGSADLVTQIVNEMPFDENGYPLPPLNGQKVIVDYIEGVDEQPSSGSTSNNPPGQPIFFEDYDLNRDGKIDNLDLQLWVKKKDDGEITVAELGPIVQDLYQFILGIKPYPPTITHTKPILGNLPGIVVAEERDMWFQKAGGWYRETAGAFANINKLEGNNPHVGATIDNNGVFSTYDGGKEYLSIFNRCQVPDFDGPVKITTTATTLFENNFINYNYGIFNGIPTNTPIYTSFLSLNNLPIDDSIIVTPTIITTPFNPDGITTIQSTFELAETEYNRWIGLIQQDPYLKYSPEWEVVKNNYNISQQNHAQEINTEACDENLTLELCIDKNPQGDVGPTYVPRLGPPTISDPCANYIVDRSNLPYIVFRDPNIPQNPIVSFNEFSECCNAAAGTYKQFLAPDGSTGEYCATNAPCAGKRLETREDGVVIFEMVKANVVPDNIYKILSKCYQLTSSGEKYFNQKRKPQGFMDITTYVRHINETEDIPRSFYNYFSEIECGSNRTIVSTPECCAWYNLNFEIDEKSGQVHCIDQDYIDNIESNTSSKPIVATILKNIKNLTADLIKKTVELKKEDLTVVEKKKIKAEIIKGNIDKFFLKEEEKKIKKEEQNLIDPATSKEVPKYVPKANPDTKPDLYETLNVFKQSTSEGTIMKGPPKSTLSSVNTKFASSFLDPDLMQSDKWGIGKVDNLGRATFTAKDNKGAWHELDWASAGGLNDLYVKIAKINGLKFDKFVVDRINNRLIKKPKKYLKDNPRNNEYTTAAIYEAGEKLFNSPIDEVKIIFGSSEYNGFQLPLSVEGNNSIDISFDYMIKYDAATLYDCVESYDQFCGVPAIFNKNSLNNIDCLNFAIFIKAPDITSANVIREDLYNVYYNEEDKSLISKEFQETGLQAEPSLECCGAIGGAILETGDWKKENERWVKNINNKYVQLLADTTNIANIIGTNIPSYHQQRIVDLINNLNKYRNTLNTIKTQDCLIFGDIPYSDYCDNDFYLNLISTDNVCALEVTEKCGLYSKILYDFNAIIAEIEYMIGEAELCSSAQASMGQIITEIDAQLVEVYTEVAKSDENSSNEIEVIEDDIVDVDNNLTVVDLAITDKENDNSAIEIALVETEPQTDCNIYSEEVEKLDNFSVSEYCKKETATADINNKKGEVNYYNTCVREKNVAARKERETYIRLQQECQSLVLLNQQLVEAKNKNQTNVVTSLETSIEDTQQTMDDICEECGSSVLTNASLQLSRQLETTDIAVIDRVATILNTTTAQITKNDKLTLNDNEKVKLKVIQLKNTSSISKMKTEVNDLTNSKNKKQEFVATLKKEADYNKKELDGVINNITIQKGRLEEPQYFLSKKTTDSNDPTGILNFKYQKCINGCYKDYREGTTDWAGCCKGCGVILEGDTAEVEGDTVYYRTAQPPSTPTGDVITGDDAAEPESPAATVGNECCEDLLEQLESLKIAILTTYDEDLAINLKHIYGFGNSDHFTRECYEEWFQQILQDFNTYMQSVTYSYLSYLNNLSLNFNIEVNNCVQGACTIKDPINSNILTTPYGVIDLWNFDYNADYSGILIEGDTTGAGTPATVIASINQEIANLPNPPATISQTLFEPKWQTFNYTLPSNVCDLLKTCYPGKQFYISLEIEEFDCGLCILIDNIKINTNKYIVENITSSNDCLIPQLSCIIDNRKSWVYTDKGIKIKSTFPDGPCTSGTVETAVVLTTPQNRLWQDLEYRYTEYDVNHSNLIINSKSASISIDPAKSIECDVYNFWKQINCDECPTICESGDTILYEGVVKETPSDPLSAYTLSLSGTPTGISFSCNTYTDILTSEVNNLKNKYYSLTANYNESLSATYYDLKNKGETLSNFTIQDNNCESQTIVIGDYKNIDELFGLLIEESDGTLGFWESYIYNTSTPFPGGDRIEIFSGYTAQTFNQTSGLTEECCKSINTILNGTGKLGMGLGKEYGWNDSINSCTWTTIGECNGDCEYFGLKNINSISGTGTGQACEITQVPVCINPSDFLDKEPSTINVKQVFDEMVLKNLIDAKDRQTISGYPLLQLFYQLYLNANNCGKDLTGKLTYDNLFEFMEKIGDYWLDLLEQVVPATTIWEGCETSGKLYRNTIFDQNKFVYKKYALNYIGIPEECAAVSGVTSESIGAAHVDIKVIEDCIGGECLGDKYAACIKEKQLISIKRQEIQKQINFMNQQIDAFNSRTPGSTHIDDCQYTAAQIDQLEQKDKPWLENLLATLQTEYNDKGTECDDINDDIIEANDKFSRVEQSCSAIAARITTAETKLALLDVNTSPYEKQKDYIAVLNNEYRKCMRNSDMSISNYNTVFITQIYDSNEFEGNVMVYGDEEWDNDGDGSTTPASPGAFYNTELIHNCVN